MEPVLCISYQYSYAIDHDPTGNFLRQTETLESDMRKRREQRRVNWKLYAWLLENGIAHLFPEHEWLSDALRKFLLRIEVQFSLKGLKVRDDVLWSELSKLFINLRPDGISTPLGASAGDKSDEDAFGFRLLANLLPLAGSLRET